MRRMLLMLTVAATTATMTVFSAVPAFAQVEDDKTETTTPLYTQEEKYNEDGSLEKIERTPTFLPIPTFDFEIKYNEDGSLEKFENPVLESGDGKFETAATECKEGVCEPAGQG